MLGEVGKESTSTKPERGAQFAITLCVKPT